jgi:hypothetical protein
MTTTQPADSRGEVRPTPESLQVCLSMASVQPTSDQDPVSRSTLDARARGCRSAEHSTPKYEVREVHYPWHPLFGQLVHVHGNLHKLGRDLCRCWLPGQEDRIGFQVPAWMLDRALCARLSLRSEPTVNWQTLLDLKQLWDKTVGSSVVTAAAGSLPSLT